jgi:hypothetical protein
MKENKVEVVGGEAGTVYTYIMQHGWPCSTCCSRVDNFPGNNYVGAERKQPLKERIASSVKEV